MGTGYWNTTAYTNAASARRAAGKDDFGYTSAMRNTPRNLRKAAASLDAFGATVREARDSADHPNSTPIAVLFDVTGSMGGVPRTLQKRLPDLLGLLTRGGYAQDPQILVGAIGDDVYDRVPLQIGQFESDNRIDEQLRDIYLEGGGGGDRREGYALASWFLATRAQLDSLDKRGRKGYCFLIGDEANKRFLFADSIRRYIGDEVAQDLSIEEVYRLLEEKFHVYFVVPNLTSYYDQPWLEEHWREIVGERFLKLDDPDAVCDLIALTVGIMEESITLDEGLQDLNDLGLKTGAAVGKALATLGAPNAGGLLPADL
ncbi:hypothetical protein [Tessaracoccus caeni]|uniref:hypothetical protein n=1 Tax=Tessaracoccus caeni TaxID=3031239 RepID=UPI0023D99215|nr:hypothetical protein [Tessaracoccus caeni]MDF1487451.1 hypothetical protein [Tessaracoccus caeni]